MAIAIMAAAGRVAAEAIADVVWIAELGLDGCLRSVRGVLPAMIAARRAGVRRVVVPSANAAEATLVDAVDVRAADTLAQVLDWLQGAGPPLPAAQPGPEFHDDDRAPRPGRYRRPVVREAGARGVGCRRPQPVSRRGRRRRQEHVGGASTGPAACPRGRCRARGHRACTLSPGCSPPALSLFDVHRCKPRITPPPRPHW